MQEIDDEILEESEKKRSNKPWLRVTVIAACAALVIAAAVAAPLFKKAPETPEQPAVIDKDRYDKNKTALSGEAAIEWSWTDKTPAEKYTVVTLDGVKYVTRGNEINKDLLSESLGICEANGYDTYTEKTYTEKFESRAVKNVDKDKIIAVNIEGTYVVFRRDMYSEQVIPMLFKEFYEEYGLTETLKLETYCDKDGYNKDGWFKTDAGQYVIDVLATCGDAPLVSADGAYFSDKNGITFTVTSEPLGIYKKSLIVTEDGYLCTNIAEYGYSFEIGAEKANEIISYVKAHSEKTEMEPFYNSVAGVITEIHDGYILVDDSVLCKDEKDGIVYKIPADSMIVRRWIENTYPRLNVGDAVMIEYKGDISKDYTVNGIVSMNEARIFEDGIYVEE